MNNQLSIKFLFAWIVLNCLTSCSEKQDVKYINSANICDSINLEKISSNEYLFKLNDFQIPATKIDSRFILHLDGKEITAIIKNDKFLYLNGLEYFKETKNDLGNLNQDWAKASCYEELGMFPIFTYESDDNKFSISEGSYELYLTIKKVDSKTYNLYFDHIDGTITFNKISRDYRNYIDKTTPVGTIKFLSDNIVELTWIGLYNTQKKNIISLISSFENSQILYLVGNYKA